MKPSPDGKLTPVEVGLAPDAVAIVDGMQTPAAGLQAGRPVGIGPPPRRADGVVQGAAPELLQEHDPLADPLEHRERREASRRSTST